MTDKEAAVRDLISKWIAYRSAEPEPARYLTLRKDLYNVRNSVPGRVYPTYLVDSDDEAMASVEHYFLGRGWVGNAVYPAWEMRAMARTYDLSKILNITPRHNPNKPVTPLSLMQIRFQEAGITTGELDLKKSGKTAPIFTRPPKYF